MRYLVIAIASVVLFFPTYWLFHAVVGPNWGPGIAVVSIFVAFPLIALNIWNTKPSAVGNFLSRNPWNQIIGTYVFAGVLYGLSVLISPWIIVAIISFFLLSFLRERIVRSIHLRKKGYYSGSWHRGKWLYEEIRDGGVESILLEIENTDPGTYELFVPNNETWRATVPAWARDRRSEIAGRISEAWKPREFHFPDDL